MVTTISAIREFFWDPDVQNEFARWQAAQERGETDDYCPAVCPCDSRVCSALRQRDTAMTSHG